MIAPFALVVDAHSLFVFSSGFDLCCIRFYDGLIEKRIGLLLPDFQSRFMKRFLQSEDVPRAESTTEVSGGRRIRNSFGTQRVQIGFVLSSQFEMLKTRAASKQVVSNVEHMIGFTIRQMHLEDRTNAIDAFCQPQLFDHLLNDTQSTSIRSLNSIGQLILNGRRSDHRRLTAPVSFVDPLCRPTLASR